MKTIVKRFSVALKKEESEQLQELCKLLGEHQTNILRKGLAIVYQNYITNKSNKTKL